MYSLHLINCVNKLNASYFLMHLQQRYVNTWCGPTHFNWFYYTKLTKKTEMNKFHKIYIYCSTKCKEIQTVFHFYLFLLLLNLRKMNKAKLYSSIIVVIVSYLRLNQYRKSHHVSLFLQLSDYAISPQRNRFYPVSPHTLIQETPNNSWVHPQENSSRAEKYFTQCCNQADIFPQ